MNERILELAKQASIWANQFEEHWGDGPDTEELFKQKFAELIQQDCLQHLTNVGLDHAREVLERYFAGR